MVLPIQVRVLYFGQTKDAAGVSEETVRLPDGASVNVLVDHCKKAHEKLYGLSDVSQVAVNEEIARSDDVLVDGDVAAFLPPVAGG